MMATASFAAVKKIVRDMDRFELVYKLRLPNLDKKGTLWITLARTDAHQKLQALAIFFVHTFR